MFVPEKGEGAQRLNNTVNSALWAMDVKYYLVNKTNILVKSWSNFCISINYFCAERINKLPQI